MSERRFLLATRSAHKASEIRDILGPAIQLLSLDDSGIAVSSEEDRVEAYDTFRANAIAKARYFHVLSGLPTLADDSGICADALGGQPGVRSRRFSGRTDLDGTELDRENNRTLVAALAATPPDRRTVRYVCAAVLVADDGPEKCAIGTVTGSLIDEPRGNAGFGYDPHFLLPGTDVTFAEVDPAEKHRLSHRGIAFRALAGELR